MPVIDPQASSKMQPELLPGESLYWAGMPNPQIIFHSDDWYLVPFSLLWGGFAIFWEASVLGYAWTGSRTGNASTFMALWGIPFIVVGQYMIWGRFFYDAWLKRRTYYAVTNRRILVKRDGWKRKVSATFLESLPEISQEGSRIGTLWFGPKYPVLAGEEA